VRVEKKNDSHEVEEEVEESFRKDFDNGDLLNSE